MFLKNMSLYTGTTPLITFRGIDRCSSSLDTISAQCGTIPILKMSIDIDVLSIKYKIADNNKNLKNHTDAQLPFMEVIKVV